MINLAWGGLINGQIDTSILVDVSGKGDYLERTAATEFLAMREALHAATGVWINPAPGSSCYRPVAIQEQFYAAYLAGTGNVAAVPTTRGGQGSNHGWGRAIDITGYETSDAVWQWLLAHAGDYGYSWGTGRASGERWHWECLTTPGTTIAAATPATPIQEEEDDMSNLVLLRRQANNAAYNIIPGRMIKHVPNANEEHLTKYALATSKDYQGCNDADLGVLLWTLGFPELNSDLNKLPLNGLYYWRAG